MMSVWERRGLEHNLFLEAILVKVSLHPLVKCFVGGNGLLWALS